MEVYPEKMDGTLHIKRYAHYAVYRSLILSGYNSIHQKSLQSFLNYSKIAFVVE